MRARIEDSILGWERLSSETRLVNCLPIVFWRFAEGARVHKRIFIIRPAGDLLVAVVFYGSIGTIAIRPPGDLLLVAVVASESIGTIAKRFSTLLCITTVRINTYSKTKRTNIGPQSRVTELNVHRARGPEWHLAPEM